MAPKLVVNHQLNFNNIQNNTNIKKLNHALMINLKLRKNVSLLSNQNKELSSTINNLLLQKLALENENNSLKKSNIQLTGMCHTVCNKLGLLEKSIQMCVPALVTMSSCIPSMLENVHEMSILKKFNESHCTEKKERQTKTVRPMVNGMTIKQPAVSIKRLDLSTINESSSPEQTPRRSKKLSVKRPSPNQLNLEPYVRLKDVKLMIRNSKTVPNENSYCQLDENLGEGPSWLYSQENQMHNSDSNNVTNNLETSIVLNETATPIVLSNSNSRNSISNRSNEIEATHGMNNELNETEAGHSTSNQFNEMVASHSMNNQLNETEAGHSMNNQLNETETGHSMSSQFNETVASHSMSNQLNGTEAGHSTSNQLNTTEASHVTFMSPAESSIMRNITCRKRTTRRSSETSIASDINNSSVSLRSKRSASKNVNYKEPNCNSKLRRK